MEAHGKKIFDTECLVSVFNTISCSKCKKKGTFMLNKMNNRRQGLNEVLSIVCKKCKNNHVFNTSKKVSHCADVNYRSVYATLTSGGGYTSF